MMRAIVFLLAILSVSVFSSDTPCTDDYNTCRRQGVSHSVCYAVWRDCIQQTYGEDIDPLNQAPEN